MKINDSGESVKTAQRKLAAEGFDPGPIDGLFGPRTRSAVVAFQQSHLGPERKPLPVTGQIDAATLWALDNPAGEAQTQGIKPNPIPGKKSPRDRVLTLCRQWHALPIVEIPNGSNTGGHVTQFHRWFGLPPLPWCAMSATKVIFDATGVIPWGKKIAGVANLLEHCRRLPTMHVMRAFDVPTPGDLFVMVHHDGTGHIGIVDARDAACRKLDVWEGNSGNRWAFRRRSVGAGDHCAYINWAGDAGNPPEYAVGLSPFAGTPASTR